MTGAAVRPVALWLNSTNPGTPAGSGPARGPPAHTPREHSHVTKAAPIAGAEVRPGKAYPLGASYDGFGTNFAVFSEVAERVELCLFDAEGAAKPGPRCPRSTASSGTATCANIEPGQCYGYRCTAPRPGPGAAMQPGTSCFDPYAKAIDGHFDWDQSLFGYNFGEPDSRNDDDSAAQMPKSVGDQPSTSTGR